MFYTELIFDKQVNIGTIFWATVYIRHILYNGKMNSRNVMLVWYNDGAKLLNIKHTSCNDRATSEDSLSKYLGSMHMKCDGWTCSENSPSKFLDAMYISCIMQQLNKFQKLAINIYRYHRYMMLMRMEFFYTWKMTIFAFLCILALSTAYSQTGYMSAQGYTSTTLALSNVTVPHDWSLFL